jgi:hypothetical protein
MRTIASALSALFIAALTPVVASAGEHHKGHSAADPSHPTIANATGTESHSVPCTLHKHSLLQRLHNVLTGHSRHNDPCTPAKVASHGKEGHGSHVAGDDGSHIANHDRIAIEDVDYYLEHYFGSAHGGHDALNGQWEIRAAQVEHHGEHFVIYHATNVHDLGLRYTLLSLGQHTRCLNVWEPVR